MSKGLMCAGLMLLGLSLGGSVSLGKPPDLPVDLRVEFEGVEKPGGLCLDFDIFSGKVSLNIALPGGFWQSLFPDRTVPSAAAVSGRPNAACPPREPRQEQEPDSDRLIQARTLFEIAERCRKVGDLDKARTCYEETHLLAPDTRFGRRAMDRLAEIDQKRVGGGEGNAEEAEEPDLPDGRRHEDMLRRTVPLGGVPVPVVSRPR